MARPILPRPRRFRRGGTALVAAMASSWQRFALCALLAFVAVARPAQPVGATFVGTSCRAGANGTAIVTLGQALNSDGTPPQTLVKRIEETAAAYRELGNVSIIVTGADPVKVGITEAEVMRQMLTKEGVPEASIFLEPQADNTVQNAIYSAPILKSLGACHVVLVSSDFHLPRALYTFEAVFEALAPGVGMSVKPRATRGGCAMRDAASGTGINEESLIQRLKGEVRIMDIQMTAEYLPSDLPDVPIASPGSGRIRAAHGEARALLAAAEDVARGDMALAFL